MISPYTSRIRPRWEPITPIATGRKPLAMAMASGNAASARSFDTSTIMRCASQPNLRGCFTMYSRAWAAISRLVSSWISVSSVQAIRVSQPSSAISPRASARKKRFPEPNL